MTPDEIVGDFEAAVTESYIGFWWVTGAAKTLANSTDRASVRAHTLHLVRMMLSRGFHAGHLAETGNGFVDWLDQNPDAVIRRIEAEWDELEHEPTINDICWFDRN